MDERCPIFLGIAQRANHYHLGWQLDGVSSFLFSPFFPSTLRDAVLLFAVPRALAVNPTAFRVGVYSRRQQKEICSIDVGEISSSAVSSNDFVGTASGSAAHVSEDGDNIVRCMIPADSSHAIMPIGLPHQLILEPDALSVSVQLDDEVHELGVFYFGFLRTPPLSDREIKKATTKRKHLAYVQVKCAKCDDKITVYMSLLRNDAPAKIPKPNESIWRIGDVWACSCGETIAPMRYLRLGMHEIFRHSNLRRGESLRLSTSFQRDRIGTVIDQYHRLIESTPSEESVQKFLEENYVMWSFLGPLDTIPKPKVLANHVGDFAVLSSNRTLFLIEIEKPQTKLAKDKGGQSAEIQQGIDQINDWRVLVQDHRQALLDTLKIDGNQIDSIRFVLIAGHSRDVDAKQLRSIRESIQPDTMFLTFDELAGYTECLQEASPL